MNFEPSFIKEPDGTIKININTDLADNLVYILDKLLDLAEEIKRQTKIKQSFEKANNMEERIKRLAQFEEKAIVIYKRFNQLIKKEFKENKRGAINQIKEEYNFKLSIDAEIHITEGRKAQRKKEKGIQQNLFIQGVHPSQPD